MVRKTRLPFLMPVCAFVATGFLSTASHAAAVSFNVVFRATDDQTTAYNFNTNSIQLSGSAQAGTSFRFV